MKVRLQWFCRFCGNEGDLTVEKSNFREYAKLAQAAHLAKGECVTFPQFYAYPVKDAEKCDNGKEAKA